jgi:hypothetical protein
MLVYGGKVFYLLNDKLNNNLINIIQQYNIKENNLKNINAEFYEKTGWLHHFLTHDSRKYRSKIKYAFECGWYIDGDFLIIAI